MLSHLLNAQSERNTVLAGRDLDRISYTMTVPGLSGCGQKLSIR